MKKTILSSALFILFALPVFSQVLKPLKIDSLVTVSIPPVYQKKDTLGQQTIAANGLYGYMAVLRAVNEKNNAPLKKETDLNKVFKDYIRDIESQSNGAQALNIRDTVIGTLKGKLFTLHTDNGQGDIQLRKFALIYTTDANYTFEYVYPESRGDVVNGEYKAFMSSIRLSPQLQRNDQYLFSGGGMSSVIRIGLISLGGIALIFIITVIVKRRRLALQ